MPISGRRVAAASGAKRPRVNSGTKVTGYNVVVGVTAKGTVSAAVKDYTKDPYFVKKAEAAKAVIEKIGLPKKK